jgi:GAF domain-containing protein
MTYRRSIGPTDAFAEIGRIPFREVPLDEVLTRIADLAGHTVPGTGGVSVTLLGPGGAHSSLSVGLPLRGSFTGALNLYSAVPHAFDEDSVILAQTFAGYAAVAMADAPRPAPGL